MSALTDLIAQSPAIAVRIQTAIDDLQTALADREQLGADIRAAAVAVLQPTTKPTDAAVAAADLANTALPRDSGVVDILRGAVNGTTLDGGDISFAAVGEPLAGLVAATIAGAAQATATAERWEE